MSDTKELWRKYKSDRDSSVRQEIISHYAYLAKYVVDRLLIRPSAAMGYDDLVGHAIVGLIDAVERFDVDKGVKFETYAIVRIRGTVLDAVNGLDWKPRSVRTSEQALKRAFADLEVNLGRPPTDAEAAQELGVDVDTLHKSLSDFGQSSLLSLEELMVTADDCSPMSSLAGGNDPDGDPLFAAELSERKRLLAQAIEALPEREKFVVSLYYKEELTLKEIAAVLGVTESRVCQMHSKAVIRLHGKLARHQQLLLAAA